MVEPNPRNNSDGDFKQPFLIGVAGGSASGKKSVCRAIMKAIGEKPNMTSKKVELISLENFYRVFTPEELELARNNELNFDHPDAFDWKLLDTTLQSLLKGQPAYIPKYDFTNRVRKVGEYHIIESPDVVLCEGILMLYRKRIRDAFDMKLFVDVDSDIRLSRQVVRDTQERYTHPLETVLAQYVKYVKPAFEDFILPTKKFADIIIPRGPSNTVAIDLIAQHIHDVLVLPPLTGPSNYISSGFYPMASKQNVLVANATNESKFIVTTEDTVPPNKPIIETSQRTTPLPTSPNRQIVYLTAEEDESPTTDEDGVSPPASPIQSSPLRDSVGSAGVGEQRTRNQRANSLESRRKMEDIQRSTHAMSVAMGSVKEDDATSYSPLPN